MAAARDAYCAASPPDDTPAAQQTWLAALRLDGTERWAVEPRIAPQEVVRRIEGAVLSVLRCAADPATPLQLAVTSRAHSNTGPGQAGDVRVGRRVGEGSADDAGEAAAPNDEAEAEAEAEARAEAPAAVVPVVVAATEDAATSPLAVAPAVDAATSPASEAVLAAGQALNYMDPRSNAGVTAQKSNYTKMRNFLLTALLSASSASLVDLHHATQIPAGWRATPERVSGDAVFHNVMVGLKRSNTAKLSQLVAEVSDPQGANYLNYPSYEALGDMVRPQAEHTASVKAWVAEHGAAIVGEHPHGDYLTLRATAAQLEAMSNGAFTTYVHGSTGMKVHRITDGVRVPDAVAGAVDTFSGFHGFPLEPKEAKAKVNAKCPVTPPVVRSTYNVSHVKKTGKANIQAIAQFQGEDVSPSELSSFCKEFDPASGSCTIQKFVGPNQPSRPGLESMLDTEYSVPLSQDSATWVYSYPNYDFCSDLVNFGTNVTSESTHPYVISVSYGSQTLNTCSKELSTRFAADIEKMAAMGITVMISSGDDGSGHFTRGGTNAGKLNPSYPASIPHAVAVGATYFIDGTSGPEQAATLFGSGGGFSYGFTAPSYQTSAISTYLSTVTLPTQYAYAKGGRGTPDVSALGEQFAVGLYGQVMCVSGTSASSPSFAGLVTLLNEVCMAAGGKSLGFANPLFYQNPGMFNDVTHGTNAVQGNTEGWAAIKGWDASTGLGTPNFARMVAVVEKACRK